MRRPQSTARSHVAPGPGGLPVLSAPLRTGGTFSFLMLAAQGAEGAVPSCQPLELGAGIRPCPPAPTPGEHPAWAGMEEGMLSCVPPSVLGQVCVCGGGTPACPCAPARRLARGSPPRSPAPPCPAGRSQGRARLLQPGPAHPPPSRSCRGGSGQGRGRANAAREDSPPRPTPPQEQPQATRGRVCCLHCPTQEKILPGYTPTHLPGSAPGSTSSEGREAASEGSAAQGPVASITEKPGTVVAGGANRLSRVVGVTRCGTAPFEGSRIQRQRAEE